MTTVRINNFIKSISPQNTPQKKPSNEQSTNNVLINIANNLSTTFLQLEVKFQELLMSSDPKDIDITILPSNEATITIKNQSFNIKLNEINELSKKYKMPINAEDIRNIIQFTQEQKTILTWYDVFMSFFKQKSNDYNNQIYKKSSIFSQFANFIKSIWIDIFMSFYPNHNDNDHKTINDLFINYVKSFTDKNCTPQVVIIDNDKDRLANTHKDRLKESNIISKDSSTIFINNNNYEEYSTNFNCSIGNLTLTSDDIYNNKALLKFLSDRSNNTDILKLPQLLIAQNQLQIQKTKNKNTKKIEAIEKDETKLNKQIGELKITVKKELEKFLKTFDQFVKNNAGSIEQRIIPAQNTINNISDTLVKRFEEKYPNIYKKYFPSTQEEQFKEFNYDNVPVLIELCIAMFGEEIIKFENEKNCMIDHNIIITTIKNMMSPNEIQSNMLFLKYIEDVLQKYTLERKGSFINVFKDKGKGKIKNWLFEITLNNPDYKKLINDFKKQHKSIKLPDKFINNVLMQFEKSGTLLALLKDSKHVLKYKDLIFLQETNNAIYQQLKSMSQGEIKNINQFIEYYQKTNNNLNNRNNLQSTLSMFKQMLLLVKITEHMNKQPGFQNFDTATKANQLIALIESFENTKQDDAFNKKFDTVEITTFQAIKHNKLLLDLLYKEIMGSGFTRVEHCGNDNTEQLEQYLLYGNFTPANTVDITQNDSNTKLDETMQQQIDDKLNNQITCMKIVFNYISNKIFKEKGLEIPLGFQHAQTTKNDEMLEESFDLTFRDNDSYIGPIKTDDGLKIGINFELILGRILWNIKMAEDQTQEVNNWSKNLNKEESEKNLINIKKNLLKLHGNLLKVLPPYIEYKALVVQELNQCVVDFKNSLSDAYKKYINNVEALKNSIEELKDYQSLLNQYNKYNETSVEFKNSLFDAYKNSLFNAYKKYIENGKALKNSIEELKDHQSLLNQYNKYNKTLLGKDVKNDIKDLELEKVSYICKEYNEIVPKNFENFENFIKDLNFQEPLSEEYKENYNKLIQEFKNSVKIWNFQEESVDQYARIKQPFDQLLIIYYVVYEKDIMEIESRGYTTQIQGNNNETQSNNVSRTSSLSSSIKEIDLSRTSSLSSFNKNPETDIPTTSKNVPPISPFVENDSVFTKERNL